MNTQQTSKVSKPYFFSVLLTMLVLPVVSLLIDSGHSHTFSVALAGKWFTFWAIGVRLFTAGIRQATKPAFTAQDIFHLKHAESHVLVRELGFANICFGLAGILSLFMPQLCLGAAFTGGLYLGIAGILHIIKKPSSPNEVVAMVSDIFIFLVMAGYVGLMVSSSAFDIGY